MLSECQNVLFFYSSFAQKGSLNVNLMLRTKRPTKMQRGRNLASLSNGRVNYAESHFIVNGPTLFTRLLMKEKMRSYRANFATKHLHVSTHSDSTHWLNMETRFSSAINALASFWKSLVFRITPASTSTGRVITFPELCFDISTLFCVAFQFKPFMRLVRQDVFEQGM